MISCNFFALETPIRLSDLSTIFIIEDSHVYGRVIYSLYQREQGLHTDEDFLIFDDSFQEVKSLVTVQNPLTFSLDSNPFKKLLFQKIISTLDMDEKQRIEQTYHDLVQYFNQQIFEDVEIEVSISEAYKLEDLFKLLKIEIYDHSTSIFERSQLILNVLKELSKEDLIIFCGLGSLLAEKDMNLLIETANLNQQRVLFLENREIENMKNTKIFQLDQDFNCWEKMV